MESGLGLQIEVIPIHARVLTHLQVDHLYLISLKTLRENGERYKSNRLLTRVFALLATYHRRICILPM